MKNSHLLLCTSLVWILQSSIADAIDLQPNDARPPPPGINSVQVSYQYSERGDFYAHGDKTITNLEISSDLYLWRVGHSFEIAEHPAYFYAQVPTGAVHPQKSLAVELTRVSNQEKVRYGFANDLHAPSEWNVGLDHDD